MGTVLRALENAERNLVIRRVHVRIGAEQLRNAIAVLKKGYGLSDDIDELLRIYGAKNIPEKPKERTSANRL